MAPVSSLRVRAAEGLYEEKILVDRFRRFEDCRAARAPKAEDSRWRHVVDLEELLEQPQFRGVMLGGRDNAVYEIMYRSNPSRFMALPRFLVAMRRIFGFELAPSRGLENEMVRRMMEKLFEAFDEDSTGRIDWRLIIVMLHAVRYRHLEPVEHVRWGFALLGAEGTLDATCSDPFDGRICDLKDLLFCLCRITSRPEMIALIDKAWFALTIEDPTAQRIARRATMKSLLMLRGNSSPHQQKPRSMYNNCGSVVDDVKLSKALFEKLLETEPISTLLRKKALPFGSKDSRPWTYEIEENHFHPILLGLIKAARRERRNDRCVAKFNAKHKCQVRWPFTAWRFKATFSRKCDRLCVVLLQFVHHQSERLAFERWVLKIATYNHARNIQRVARGGVGRRSAMWVRRVRHLVVSVQSRFRGFLTRVDFERRHKLRALAATEIQSRARRMQAKRFVTYRLELSVDRKRRALESSKREWSDKRLVAAARLLQSTFRARRARIMLEQERRRRIAAILTVNQMRAHDLQVERQRKIYETMLSEWYEERRKDAIQEQLYDDFTNAEKAKILRYRSQEAHRELQLKKQRDAELADMLEDRRVEEWIARWNEIKKERVEKLKARLNQCRLDPETPHEKAVQKKIKREIKKRLKGVLRRMREDDGSSGGTLLDVVPDARQQAFDEYVAKCCLDEEKRVEEDKKEAAEAYYAAQDAKRQNEEYEKRRYYERVKDFYALKIQRQWTAYQARKELRFRCKTVFTKEYDAEVGQAYYLNRKTGKSQWRKPFALGNYDIRLKDRWIVVRDETNVPYYYNPSTLAMTWKQPAGTLLCQDCHQNDTFCEAYFRKLYLCRSCLLAHCRSFSLDNDPTSRQQLAQRGLWYKLLDGALPTAIDVNPSGLREYLMDEKQLQLSILPNDTGDCLSFASFGENSNTTGNSKTTGESSSVCVKAPACNNKDPAIEEHVQHKEKIEGEPTISLLERAQRAATTYMAEAAVRAAKIRERRLREEVVTV